VPSPPALVAETSHHYREAGERWRAFGNVPERAYALLGQGHCLAALGKPEAEAPLREARELFAALATSGRSRKLTACSGRPRRRHCSHGCTPPALYFSWYLAEIAVDQKG
jgi:hypothetical protein